MDSPLSHRELLAIAKEQLGLNESVHESQVPAEYVEELRHHTQLYPDDTHFLLSPQPGQGYGYAMCLEEGCNYPNIPLDAQAGLPDGGMAFGIGSLSAYRDHIVADPAHLRSRNDRLRYMDHRVEPGMMSSPPSTPAHSSTYNTTDSEQEAVTPTRFGSSSPIRPIGSRMMGLAVKNEPVEATIPRKRPSDVELARLPAPFSWVKPEDDISDKKPRLGALAGPQTDDPSHTPSASSSAGAVEDTRAKIDETISKIASVQAALQRVRRKSHLSKADITRMVNLEQSLKELQAQRQAFSASIPSAPTKPLSRNSSAVMPASLVKTEPVASGSNVQLPLYPLPSATVKANLDIPIWSQAVASGSNVKIETFPSNTAATSAPEYEYYSSDDDYEPEGGYDNDHWKVYQMPAAKADDIDKFLVAAGNSEQFDGNESVDKALEKLKLPNLYQPLPGMQVALMPHQAIGVAWMLEKERNPSMKGGCLADEMGLGKTVQMISVIATNPSTNPARKSTLILCPVALLDQWQQEIEAKTNLDLTCLIYHGNNKPRRASEIAKYDIVLTTFHTLAYEWPDLEAEEMEKEKARRRKQGDEVKPKKKRGAKKELGKLFLVEWHRIVIDEAQNVRNRRTRVSRAVAELEATYRWCLTGTPIINTLSDAYGLLRFLRIRPWYDWAEFNSRIARYEKKDPGLASTRLQAIFKTVLLRRKKDSELDGEKLIQLPPKEVIIRKLEFTQEERDIYSMVEANAQAKFNRFLRAGTVLKNYHHVFATLLRLRQICAHPILIQEQGDGDGFVHADEEGGDHNSELARAARLVSMDFVSRMKQKFKDIAAERMAAELNQAGDAELEGEECPICYDALTDAIVTCCSHSFCRECITNVLNAPAHHDANEPNKYKAHERPCPSCRGAISQDLIFSRQAFEPIDEDLADDKVKDEEDFDMGDDTSEPEVDIKGKGKAPARRNQRRASRPVSFVDSEDEEGNNPDDDLSDFIVDDDEDEEEADARIALRRAARKSQPRRRAIVISDDEDDDAVIYGPEPVAPAALEKVKMMARFLPSTKMKYMMDCLLTWAQEHPEEKVLIISQWTQCLDLVSRYLIEKGFAHVKYQGNMTRNQRDASVRSFMAKKKATVMLMSLKCGGVGLNLTRANRVISLDLGWSEAIESQAFDRVHRLGQTRSVTVERLVISNTVEDRILALQETKRNLADGSLGEGNGKKIGRLTVKQLASLFNMDTRGNILT